MKGHDLGAGEARAASIVFINSYDRCQFAVMFSRLLLIGVATPPLEALITDLFHPPHGGKRSRIPEEESLLPRVLDAVLYM